MIYEKLTEEQKAIFQNARQRIGRIRDYVDISDSEALRINAMMHRAEEIFDEEGDISIFTKCANAAERKFLTQVF